jgi:hypothetical protein
MGFSGAPDGTSLPILSTVGLLIKIIGRTDVISVHIFLTHVACSTWVLVPVGLFFWEESKELLLCPSPFPPPGGVHVSGCCYSPSGK